MTLVLAALRLGLGALTPRTLGVLGLGAAVILLLGLGHWRAGSAQRAAERAQAEAVRLEAALRLQAAALADREAALAELSAALVAAESRAARGAEILREIDHAPAADDGPLAPVLGRALERLRRP